MKQHLTISAQMAKTKQNKTMKLMPNSIFYFTVEVKNYFTNLIITKNRSLSLSLVLVIPDFLITSLFGGLLFLDLQFAI